MVDLEKLIKINESGKKALEYTDKIFNLLERMRADVTAQTEHPMHFTIGSTSPAVMRYLASVCPDLIVGSEIINCVKEDLIFFMVVLLFLLRFSCAPRLGSRALDDAVLEMRILELLEENK